MNPNDFFRKSLDQCASVKGISSTAKKGLIDRYMDRYMRGQFSGGASSLFSEIKTEAKKIAKVEKEKTNAAN